MQRRTVLAALAMVASLVVLAGLGSFVLDRDRRAAEDELARDRLDTVTGAARTLGGDLAEIGTDLSLASTLLAQASGDDGADRALRAITLVKRAYLSIEARDRDGVTRRAVAADAPAEVVTLAAPTIERMAQTARLAPGELHISPGLSSADDLAAWYRVFAYQPTGGGLAVAAIIDMRRLVAPPELLRAGPSRLLVLSAHGVPAPASDPAVATAIHDDGSALHDLLAEARARRAGVARLDAAAAVALGLPDAPAVAVAAPVPIDAGPPWILMQVTSMQSLETRHQALVTRMGIGGLLGLLLVVAATVYVVRNARRAASLRERLRNAELLAHLSEKAEQIVDHIPSGVLAIDDLGVITASNRWFGERQAGLVGRKLDDVFEAADVDRVRALVGDARATRQPRTLRRSPLELFGTGSILTLHAIPLANPLADASLLLVVEDDSAVQRAEDRLIRSEKLATAGQLAAGIAHEIGTPLAVARGRAEMTLLRGRVDDGDAANLRAITDRIDHVSKLIEQLLDFVRPHRTNPEAVAAARSMRGVVDMLAPQATSRKVELALDVDGDPQLRADPGQLQQVLVNLVMNALDACEPGGRVTLRARDRATDAVIEVVDDGAGIAAEEQAHVFDPFFTTKKRGRGTGLGLWVVAQVVRAHDAEIELDSQLGVGSTFRIAWPKAPARSA